MRQAKFVHIFCVFFAFSAAFNASAQSSKPGPLTSATAPPCPQHSGIRSVRSSLVQYGDITASISAQASQAKGGCVKSASLWVTQKNTSRQFDLPDAAANTFAIVDIAPDSSAILLSATAAAAPPHVARPVQIALIPLDRRPSSDEALKWMSVARILKFQNCDADLGPQGFSDPAHVIVISSPPARPGRYPACTASSLFFSLDLAAQRVKQISPAKIDRSAQSVSGPRNSCKTDPDVSVRACYTTRARLSVAENGKDMLIWPTSSTHYMSVGEGMLPSDLSSRVAPNMRVYATMVICPLSVPHSGTRMPVCVDAATDFHSDPLSPKAARPASTGRPKFGRPNRHF